MISANNCQLLGTFYIDSNVSNTDSSVEIENSNFSNTTVAHYLPGNVNPAGGPGSVFYFNKIGHILLNNSQFRNHSELLNSATSVVIALSTATIVNLNFSTYLDPIRVLALDFQIGK